MIKVDTKQLRKQFMKEGQTMKMIHSLASMNYLKVEKENMIHFLDTKENSKIIAIQHSRS